MDNCRDFAREVLGPVSLLPVLEVPITYALGSRSAAEVFSPRDVPATRLAVWDGYAVSAPEVAAASSAAPVILVEGAAIAAGQDPSDSPIPAGQCVHVATGAPVPPNAAAVVPDVDCQAADDKVTVHHAPRSGTGIREVGSLFGEGAPVIGQGQYLGHVAIAELAQVGSPRVMVHPRPRVVVVTIGSELVAVGAQAGAAHLHDAAGVLLATTAERLGADCHRVGPVADDRRLVRNTLEDQLVRADIVVTVGGIGSPDDTLRAELHDEELARFDGPALDPCGPYGLGRIGPDSTPLVALPSDPVAALLAFHALVRPVMADMLGRDLYTGKEAVFPPRAATTGSRITAGQLEGGRFVASQGDPAALSDLRDTTALALHHAGDDRAEVLLWPS